MKYATINPVERYGIKGNPSFFRALHMIANANPNAIPERQFVNPKTKDEAMHNLTSAPPIFLFDILKLMTIRIVTNTKLNTISGSLANSTPMNAVIAIIKWM